MEPPIPTTTCNFCGETDVTETEEDPVLATNLTHGELTTIIDILKTDRTAARASTTLNLIHLQRQIIAQRYGKKWKASLGNDGYWAEDFWPHPNACLLLKYINNPNGKTFKAMLNRPLCTFCTGGRHARRCTFHLHNGIHKCKCNGTKMIAPNEFRIAITLEELDEVVHALFSTARADPSIRKKVMDLRDLMVEQLRAVVCGQMPSTECHKTRVDNSAYNHSLGVPTEFLALWYHLRAMGLGRGLKRVEKMGKRIKLVWNGLEFAKAYRPTQEEMDWWRGNIPDHVEQGVAYKQEDAQRDAQQSPLPPLPQPNPNRPIPLQRIAEGTVVQAFPNFTQASIADLNDEQWITLLDAVTAWAPEPTALLANLRTFSASKAATLSTRQWDGIVNALNDPSYRIGTSTWWQERRARSTCLDGRCEGCFGEGQIQCIWDGRYRLSGFNQNHHYR